MKAIIHHVIELALPAGNLETALTAFRNDADAVYFGMKEFSARASAVNFSIEDLSKIKRYCQDRGKKFYVTVNTLVDDSELEAADRLLSILDFYSPDGVIIQDLGLVRLIRTSYPSLPLHASTQLAVHTVQGVRELQDLGFERVVLSRELSLDEIASIRSACPDIELKVFIHGALCFGFSGLCMASRNLGLGSANRGSCNQICRTWFTEKTSGKNGYFFSLEDLNAGDYLIRLNQIGIDSAKIEGRLKGAEYVAALTKYYKSILSGRPDSKSRDAVMTTFSRASGSGYFDYKKERDSLLSGYPSHLGLQAGIITGRTADTISVHCSRELHPRDGLQYLKTNALGLPESVKFACSILSRKGDDYILSQAEDDDITGHELYKISSSDQHERKPGVNLPLYSRPVSIAVTLESDRLSASALGKTVSIALSISQARKPADIRAQLEEIFSQSDTASYTLGQLEIINKTGFQSPFLPLSYLKELRRTLYAAIEDIRPEPAGIEKREKTREGIRLPDRKLLERDLPWSLEPVCIDGKKYITLPPVTFEEEKLFRQAEEILEKDSSIIVGLNNIAQVRFAKQHPQYSYFADIYLYQSNAEAAALLEDELGPSFLGGYLWLERDSYSAAWPVSPCITGYTPPSFISRACFRHDAMNESCRGCRRNYDYSISQNRREYTVKVRDCLTVVQLKK